MIAGTGRKARNTEAGPPFAVLRDEVEQYYSGAFSITLLEANDVIDERPRWREAGMTALGEAVFRLDR